MILLLLGISFFMNRLPESALTQGAKSLATCAAAFLVTFIGQQCMGSTESFSLPRRTRPYSCVLVTAARVQPSPSVRSINLCAYLVLNVRASPRLPSSETAYSS